MICSFCQIQDDSSLTHIKLNLKSPKMPMIPQSPLCTGSRKSDQPITQAILELKCPSSIALLPFPALTSLKIRFHVTGKQYLLLSIPPLSSGISLPPTQKCILGTISFSSVPNSSNLNLISVSLNPAPSALIGGNP